VVNASITHSLSLGPPDDLYSIALVRRRPAGEAKLIAALTVIRPLG
jgi:hypothetical protein